MVVARVWFSVSSVCLSMHLSVYVCLFFHTISQKLLQCIEMFHHESWKPIYFGVKGTTTGGTKTVPAMAFCTLERQLLVSIYFQYVVYCCE